MDQAHLGKSMAGAWQQTWMTACAGAAPQPAAKEWRSGQQLTSWLHLRRVHTAGQQEMPRLMPTGEDNEDEGCGVHKPKPRMSAWEGHSCIRAFRWLERCK